MGFFDFFKGKNTEVEENQKQPTADELFLKGKDIEKENPEEAFRYFSRSASLGKAEAMNKLGFCYFYQGRGADFDIDKSFTWFKKGAEKGDAGSMMMLSQFYMSGVGTTQDDVVAKQWIKRAAAAGDERIATSAMQRLDDYDRTRSIVTTMMNTAVEMGGMPPK